MKIYEPTKKQEDALWSHLQNYYDNIYELNHEFTASENDYYDAVDEKDKEEQKKCLNDMAMINKRIEAIYKAATLIATAYKETETLF